MQVDRIAGVARLAGSVRGLGVCDVLRAELAPVQRAGLEAELAARTADLERPRPDFESDESRMGGAKRAGPMCADARPSGTASDSARPAGSTSGGVRPASAAWFGVADPFADEDERRDVQAELRLLARMHSDLPAASAEPFTLTGPAGLVLEVVGACLVAAVAAADARLGEGGRGVPWVAACERELEAAAAWIATALDCRAVEGFCFEPGADPVHAW